MCVCVCVYQHSFANGLTVYLSITTVNVSFSRCVDRHYSQVNCKDREKGCFVFVAFAKATNRVVNIQYTSNDWQY